MVSVVLSIQKILNEIIIIRKHRNYKKISFPCKFKAA